MNTSGCLLLMAGWTLFVLVLVVMGDLESQELRGNTKQTYIKFRLKCHTREVWSTAGGGRTDGDVDGKGIDTSRRQRQKGGEGRGDRRLKVKQALR